MAIVRGELGLGQREVALTLASYGGGSMLAAFILPHTLERVTDRAMIITAAATLTLGLVVMAGLFALGHGVWGAVLAGWFMVGIAYSMSVTPSGRLLRRSANAENRPALFAAQFALSHGCWLLYCPLAGQIGAPAGQAAAFATLSVVASVGTIAAFLMWPSWNPKAAAHSHDDLPPRHPLLQFEV